MNEQKIETILKDQSTESLRAIYHSALAQEPPKRFASKDNAVSRILKADRTKLLHVLGIMGLVEEKKPKTQRDVDDPSIPTRGRRLAVYEFYLKARSPKTLEAGAEAAVEAGYSDTTANRVKRTLEGFRERGINVVEKPDGHYKIEAQ